MEPSLAQPSSIALNTVNKAAMRSPGIFIIFMLWSYLWREIVAAAITQKGPAGVNRRGTSRQARYCGRGHRDRIAVMSVASAPSSHAFFATTPKGLESLLLAELAALGAAGLRATRAAVEFATVQSQISHSHFGALKVKDAIVDRFRAREGRRPSVEREQPSVRINV